MMRHLKYSLLLFLAISCNNNSIEKPKKPKNLIKKDKMVEIIYDMTVFTAAKGVNKRIIENKGILPEDYIYIKYNIDSTQFAQSNEYYAYNLDSYEDIYAKVKLKLQKEKTYYDSIIDADSKQKKLLNKKQREERDSLLKNKRLLNKGEKLKSVIPNPLKNMDTIQ
jgi:Domain of unknown function (DUF4296)